MQHEHLTGFSHLTSLCHAKIECFLRHNFLCILIQLLFLISDENEVRNLVVWLEDRKVRRYKIEDRQALRDPSSNLTEVLDKYFRDLGCPIVDLDLAAKLEWLLGFAVTLEYTDGGKVPVATPWKHVLCKAMKPKHYGIFICVFQLINSVMFLRYLK